METKQVFIACRIACDYACCVDETTSAGLRQAKSVAKSVATEMPRHPRGVPRHKPSAPVPHSRRSPTASGRRRIGPMRAWPPTAWSSRPNQEIERKPKRDRLFPRLRNRGGAQLDAPPWPHAGGRWRWDASVRRAWREGFGLDPNARNQACGGPSGTPSGVRAPFSRVTGGVVAALLNHRLLSGKPPASGASSRPAGASEMIVLSSGRGGAQVQADHVACGVAGVEQAVGQGRGWSSCGLLGCGPWPGE